ncbi:MAG TPA: FG-GAP-like repeat-containing protein, partial [Pyrinomonadaceae bacterium]|nr:FG-GAP-like repeat-containing protein [Pyrinomonadaceae bacterium]
MRFFKAAPVLALLLVSLPALPRPGVGQNEPRRGGDARSDLAKREEAYRANNLGVALLEQFRHAEGAEAFRRALRLDPRAAAPRINLAVALYNVPELDAALHAAREAAEAAPRAPQPRYLLGLIARQQNRPDEALSEFRRVHALDPSDVGTNVNLGQLLAQRREYKEAITHFRAAVAAEPYNGTALYNLGTALLRAGEREEGQRVIQKFQELRQSGAATTVGNSYLEQGRYAEAVTTTGAEPELVERATPRVTFKDATANVLKRPREVEISTGRTPRLPLAFGRRLRSAKLNAQTKAELASTLGGGVTLFDLDGDGLLDLFDASPTSPATPARLYRNDGRQLVEITRGSGINGHWGGVHVGAVAGDYDNDGRQDLFVLRYGTSSLYRNLGGGKFEDVTKASGLPVYTHLPSSAAFVDYDHDGDLDLFVAGFVSLEVASSPRSDAGLVFPDDFPPARNLLLRNNGDGTFADVSVDSRVAEGPGRALSVVPTDFDNRRDVDLLVTHYNARPTLYRNLRDGTFKDVSGEVGLASGAENFAGAAAAGDVNKDEFTDFFFAAWDASQARAGAATKHGSFALSDGRGRFKVSTPAGFGALASAGAAQVLDYDNDGLLDLVAVTSAGLRVVRNVGDGWTDVSTSAVAPTPGQNKLSSTLHPRVLASADFDADGDTDLFVRGEGGALRVLRNEGGSRHASVRVRLAGKVSNRAGVGAKVEVRAGSLQQKLETYSASPAPAPSDVTFGLGPRAFADVVRVLWPSGVVQA